MFQHGEIKSISKILNDFITEFRANPLNFLYESDIRARIYNELYFFYKKKEPIKLVSKFNKDGRFFGKEDLNINPVKTEYPYYNRFDIAIMNNIDLENQPSAKRNENFWILPVKAAIEIKYCQYMDSLVRRLNSYKKDINKLTVYYNKYNEFHEFVGVSLLFVQYYNCDKTILGVNKNDRFTKITLDKGINGFIIFPEKGKIYKV